VKRGLAVLVLALAPGCANPHHARYASWEPTSPEIPATPDRSLAKARLRQSRALFERFSNGPPVPFWAAPARRRYSYIRVEDLAPDRISVTLFAIEGSRVVLRALLEVDPTRMGEVYSDDPDEDAAHWVQVFVERGTEIGTHERGAPALSVEALYDQCEREVLGANIGAAPRIYFDPNGLLMHCGFAPEDCSDCPTLSLQSLSNYSLTDIDPELPSERWFCRGDQGPVLPGAFYAFALPLECQPPTRPRKPPPPGGSPDLADICHIDPEACPMPDEGGNRARFGYGRPPICPTIRARAPSMLSVGKVEPLATWSFPFHSGAGIECGRESRVYELRITPSL
jgi:hypothetical protein